MAFLEDMFKGGNIVAGLAIGVGAVVLAPVVIPALRLRSARLAAGDAGLRGSRRRCSEEHAQRCGAAEHSGAVRHLVPGRGAESAS
jgi:hypothetical protein